MIFANTKSADLFSVSKKAVFERKPSVVFVGNRPDFRRFPQKGIIMVIVDKIALALTIIGALNWGSIGIFKFDIVAWIFNGQAAVGSRIVYTLVALAGIWCISLLFRTDSVMEEEVSAEKLR